MVHLLYKNTSHQLPDNSVLFYSVTFFYLFEFHSGNDGWFDAWAIAPIEYMSFLQWFDSFFELLKGYLPILLVFVFLIALYEGKVQAQGFKKYASAMLASFVLIFMFNAVWGVIHSLFRTYLMGLVSLPFRELLLPTLFGVIGEIALSAYFAVANAIALVYPFYRVYQQSQPQPRAAPEAE